MNELTGKELREVNGGGVLLIAACVVVAAIGFL